MMDQRWNKLGRILVNYSTRVKPGERVMIAITETDSYPLARGVYRAAVQAGAFPQVQLLSETLRHDLLKYGNDEQACWVPEIEAYGMDWADVYIGIRGAHNLYELQDIPASRLAANQSAMGRISTMRWEKTRWCLIRVPNESFAQQAKTDSETIMNMFFDSCFLNWEKESAVWEKWCTTLEKGKTVLITGKDTNLSFSVEGRKWIPFAGINNMPDGEIATAPITSTINGNISFERPGVLGGRLVEGIRLEWKDGTLISAESDTEQDFFQSVITRDKGSSLIGEFAFGTNFSINRFCNDILLDEKIGGTIHIALGRAYPECGGINESSFHWDIVKDIRQEGAVFLDGNKILGNGRILL